ncbi:phage antirepressor KilAC domain-containing protein [Bifidobacterium magnum]|uniref:BRO family, N-terminal domain and Phage antirepressor protein KilAC domain n=1 Tax=Bifidobacterium magnum TaxID=1692 RepID=A0A087B9P8_9BIFI|nr:phage antirepressor KilAC domain-containing protein [Bifidobacterium magnum]KFI67748.1 BRO family, N-terminal domain and Phage antirepressor protein KilAC domain [Bifidobacterium magnum]
MTSSIIQQTFEGHGVRIIADDQNEPWFVAKDVALILGYRDAANMLRNLDTDEKGTQKVSISHDSNDFRRMAVISESGLYSAIMRREVDYVKDEQARATVKNFQRWITHEVLPSIRKHGAYMTGQVIERTLTDPDYLIQLATTLKEERAKRLEAERTLEDQKPKVLWAKAVETSGKDILIGELAKILKQNGVETGQRRLFEWLRDNGFLMKRNGIKNMPTQKSMEAGLFRIIEKPFNHSDGHTDISFTTKVTPKGQEYFINRFIQAGGIE